MLIELLWERQDIQRGSVCYRIPVHSVILPSSPSSAPLPFCATLWLLYTSYAPANVLFVLLWGSNLLCPLDKAGDHLSCSDKYDASFSTGGASWCMKPNSLARPPLPQSLKISVRILRYFVKRRGQGTGNNSLRTDKLGDSGWVQMDQVGTMTWA